MKTPRNTGLDLLRFVLMTLGVLLHTLCAYLTSYKIPEFPVFDGGAQHWSADALVLIIHSFRMPLFFMISGFLAGHSLSKPLGTSTPAKVAFAFLKKRFQRIALPLLGSLVLILPLFRWCLTQFQDSGEALSFEMSFLWFLYHLWIFNLVVGIFRKSYVRITKLPLALWASVSILLTLWTLSENSTGVLMTSDHWLPPFSLLIFHFGYFALGGALWNRTANPSAKTDPQSLAPWKNRFTGLALGGLALFYVFGVQKIFQGHSAWIWPVNVAHSLLTLGFCLFLFRWFTNSQWTSKKTIPYLANSSYTIYLVHPIGVALLVPLAAATLDLWPRLSRPGFVFLLSMLSSFLVYEFAVRRTFLRKVL